MEEEEEEEEEEGRTGTAVRRMEKCREERRNEDRYRGAVVPIDLR